MPRLFFALWPDDLVRRQIAKVAMKLPADAGKKVKTANLHATLCFLGQIEEDQVDNIIEAANTIRAQHFRLQLDSREWWKKSQLTWMGASEPPEILETLVDDLTEALIPCGFHPDQRPFKLHITLMRNVKKPIQHFHFKPISWLVNGFSLVESVTHPEGVEYRVIQSWDFM